MIMIRQWLKRRAWRKKIKDEVDRMYKFYFTDEEIRAADVLRAHLMDIDPYDEYLDLGNADISVYNRLKIMIEFTNAEEDA